MNTICRDSDIAEGEARGYEHDGHSLVVTRRDGQLYVYVNWCPHLGIELNFQPDEFLDLDRQFLQCANHGALFEIPTGRCVLGPCKGQSLARVEFTVADGNVCITAVPSQVR